MPQISACLHGPQQCLRLSLHLMYNKDVFRIDAADSCGSAQLQSAEAAFLPLELLESCIADMKTCRQTAVGDAPVNALCVNAR